MVSYEHLREVVNKLSILLVRTDRGVYKKKYRNQGQNAVQKSVIINSYQDGNRLLVNDEPMMSDVHGDMTRIESNAVTIDASV